MTFKISRRRQMAGAGDLLARLLYWCGISKWWKYHHPNCHCDQRQTLLNQVVPFG